MIGLIIEWVLFSFIAILFVLYLSSFFLFHIYSDRCSEEETKRFLTLVRRNRGEDNGF